jgi:hypothetical protein
MNIGASESRREQELGEQAAFVVGDRPEQYEQEARGDGGMAD